MSKPRSGAGHRELNEHKPSSFKQAQLGFRQLASRSSQVNRVRNVRTRKAHGTLAPWGIAVAKKAVSAERGRPKLNDFVHSAWDRCSGRSSRVIGIESL